MSIDPVQIDGNAQIAEIAADVDSTVFAEVESVVATIDEIQADGDPSWSEVVTTA